LGSGPSGDPYLAFGKQVGLIPPDGTDKSHKADRERCKQCILGIQYGMGPWTLARRIKQSPAHARELLELHRAAYPRYWAWSEQYEVLGMLGGMVRTVFGWPLRVVAGANPRALRNFPCQANGAELLRLACCLATERGISVVAPVHDALVVEGPAGEIDEVVARARVAMDEASAIVLDGHVLRIKSQVVRYPERLLDDETRPVWERVTGILGEIDPVHY
jgi:DNA polymerase I